MLYKVLLLSAVFLPIVSGAIILFLKLKNEKIRNAVTFSVAIINLVLVIGAMIGGYNETFVLYDTGFALKISFGIDGMTRFFGLIVSVLWPFSLLYAFEYMEGEKNKNSFFAFFMMTLGSVLGVAFAGDLFTMYVFYELITLFTFPLVMHDRSKEAIDAGRKYLVYMLGGAGFALMGMIVLLNISDTVSFASGGFLSGAVSLYGDLIPIIFLVMFLGFGVKAAIMPFGKWLIHAAVAPTPVTALLHAVAVVKAGAFACIRLIYYSFGTDALKGTYAQYAAMGFCILTILYGSYMAVRMPHIKKRLAYSTISNLSYVVFGACIMTPMGLYGSLSHFLVHALTKIALFFCIGAVMHVTGKTLISEIGGLGRKMKVIFLCFTVCSICLIGIPPFSGFLSKFNIIEAAIEEGSIASFVGAGAIIVSAVLTAIYLMTIVVKAYFPENDIVSDGVADAHDPGIRMKTPIVLFSCMIFILGLLWGQIEGFLIF
ncbi:MAG: proton-conducting membrane transporter [Lachnospiraceae bacterium]|nr:proton-conducting membrane transporter [Lachnospiraceae bacterium]